MNTAEKESVKKAITDTKEYIAKIREEHGNDFTECFITAYNFRIFGSLIMHAVDPERVLTVIEAMTLTFAGAMGRMSAAYNLSDEQTDTLMMMVDELYMISMSDETPSPRIEIARTIQ